MRIRVKLYGTLRERVSGDETSEGIEIEIPEGATAQDVLRILGIAEARAAIVVMEGRILAPGDPVKAGTAVGVLQAIRGG